MPTDVSRDMLYGQVGLITSTPDQDMKSNQDCVVGHLGIAYRKRRFKADKYGEISIRSTRGNGVRTEKAKILAGECASQIFVFEFLDCLVICFQADIRTALEQNIGYEQWNNDHETAAWYIPLKKIRHWRIEKGTKP